MAATGSVVAVATATAAATTTVAVAHSFCWVCDIDECVDVCVVALATQRLQYLYERKGSLLSVLENLFQYAAANGLEDSPSQSDDGSVLMTS